MSNFKSQVELTKFAYSEVNGEKGAMVALVAKLLAENPTVLKESKRNQLDAIGESGYLAYAKVKVREHFTRVLPREQAKAAAPVAPVQVTEAIAPQAAE